MEKVGGESGDPVLFSTGGENGHRWVGVWTGMTGWIDLVQGVAHSVEKKVVYYNNIYCSATEQYPKGLHLL